MGESIDSIYFGGGTPSLLEISDLGLQIDNFREYFEINSDAEITIETNPDDIDIEKLQGWKENGINRLSIGVQSFFEDDLKWMNRAHSAQQAKRSIELARESGFQNISIDLIYGTPLLTNEKWKQNVETAIAYDIPHLSCYALTVEPRTPLQKMINEHRVQNVDPDQQSAQFLLLMQWLTDAGYEHYEISNFAKPGYRSRHNSSYWQGKQYIGIGPSAHSFDGKSRQWNIANNNTYIEEIKKGRLPYEKETLSSTQQLNEYIMTSLRTMEGLDLQLVRIDARETLVAASSKHLHRGLLVKEKNHLKLTREGKLLADGIAADLFFTDVASA